jgi:hypothetical protein
MGNNMSIGGRLIKIEASLSSIGVYQMSMRFLHKTTIEERDKPSFFWMGLLTRESIILSSGNGYVSLRKKRFRLERPC